jgi:AcrR family transcriptional regulator
MQTPHRLLRADAHDFDRNPPPLSTKERERHDRILDVGRSILARRGRHAVNLAGLAAALRITASTLRRYFPDLDALLCEILRLHVRDIAREIGKIPHDAPDRNQQRRAAYLAFTRTALGGFTEAHLLLVRDRHTLPDDSLSAIEQTRIALGFNLAGGMAYEALSHLDNPFLTPARIEAILALPEAAEIIPTVTAAPTRVATEIPPLTPANIAFTDWQDTTTLDDEKPGAWIYTAGIPPVRHDNVSRGPPP